MRPFAAPQMLWLLLILVAPLIAFFWWAWRKRQQLDHAIHFRAAC